MTRHLRGNNPGYYPTQVIADAQSHIDLMRPHSSHTYSDVMDSEDNDDGFTSMHLDFSRPKTPWPPIFEHHLKSKAGASTSHYNQTSQEVQDEITARDRYHQFQGFGYNIEKHRCAGYVSALPAQDPQEVHEVHGFQRVTMMKWINEEEQNSKDPLGKQTVVEKHLEDIHTAGDLAHVDVEHWAYEGVVLPGGKIMLVCIPGCLGVPCPTNPSLQGRWWYPHETPQRDLVDLGDSRVHDQEARKCTGPFIFWNIDGAESTRLCEDCAL